MKVPIKPITEYNNDSNIIAVISHPGWNAYQSKFEPILEQLKVRVPSTKEYIKDTGRKNTEFRSTIICEHQSLQSMLLSGNACSSRTAITASHGYDSSLHMPSTLTYITTEYHANQRIRVSCLTQF